MRKGSKVVIDPQDTEAPWGRKADGTPRKRPGRGSRPNPSTHPYHSKEWWAEYRAVHKEKLNARIRLWNRQNPDRSKKIKGDWVARNKHQRTEAQNRRRAQKIQACPAWADRSAIRAVYAECRRVNASGGERHVVDHIVPLKSDVVCGLHIAANLRVITYAENDKKRARLIEGIALAPTVANGLLSK